MNSNNTIKITKKTIPDLSLYGGLLKTKGITTVFYNNKDLLRNQPVFACITFYLICQ